MRNIRILFLADTHLGIDLPLRPRVHRRRRSFDFFENYKTTLSVALREEVDFVVHGGDLFYRSRIPQQLVFQAFEPLKEIADLGIPVLIVPGNHERSQIPYPLLTAHPQIFIFDSAHALVLKSQGKRIGFTGIPQIRKDPRSTFKPTLLKTGWRLLDVDFHLLLIHQAVEGATVGPSEYVFKYSSDVVRGRDIPRGFLAVLSGHIHRAQILLNDLSGNPIAAPVIYPGSVERTSFAEKNEPKGYFILEMGEDKSSQFELKKVDFRPLPARPMEIIKIEKSDSGWKSQLQKELKKLDPNSVVRLDFAGEPRDFSGVTASRIRRIAPTTMNFTLRYEKGYSRPKQITK